ncbi:MAG TPA: heme-binding domain-containing protein [Bryobacteraceae bacterium]|jgi:hypothetical protein|nr:heme-binding domain-containing protein [Bryobacteraceae bacterium]
MNRHIRSVAIGLGVALAGAQLLQPRLSSYRGNGSTGSNDLLRDRAVDPRIRSILKRACADCHSNQANLPWYGRVSPISWFIARHIERGREKLNFSEWPKHSEDERQDIADSVEKNEMPIWSYLFVHRGARLTPEDRKVIERWVDSR